MRCRSAYAVPLGVGRGHDPGPGRHEFGPWRRTCATTEHLSPALMHD